MTPEQYQKLKPLFDQVLEHPFEERESFARQICNGNGDLLDQLVRLVHFAGDSAGTFAGPLARFPIENRRPIFSTGQMLLDRYRIVRFLGRGGMGEVWRATDTRLGRDVAIKILPDALAKDPEWMARFQREAKVLGSLNHPNIAQIYDVEEHMLVIELVEGEMLSGPLPVDIALRYATQIADAIEAAHEKGIVHRDLKPANVMVASSGTVKILDFGLARMDLGLAADPSVSPTLVSPLSYAGVIMGTASYMAPEQARGKPVDKRADIWAFGCVLYEMFTGKQVFAGETMSDVLSAVLREEPNLDEAPAEFRPILAKCLRKNPRMRWQHIGDVRIALEEARTAGSADEPRYRRSLLPWVIVGLMSLALAVLGFALWRVSRPVQRPLMMLSVDLGPDALPGRDTTAALSPDGTRMVYPIRTQDGKQGLAIRTLGQSLGAFLPGTENGANPFFSPNGQSVAFFADGKLKRVPIYGGPTVELCDAPAGRGGSWGENGYIVAALSTVGGLSWIPENGGIPHPLTKLAGNEVTHRWPQILPGGQAIIFTANTNQMAFRNATVDALFLPTHQRKTVIRGGVFGRYLPNGQLVFLRESRLYTARFDSARLNISGPVRPVLEHVAESNFGGGQFAFSLNGTFVFLPGKLSANLRQIVWMDNAGNQHLISSTPGVYFGPRLSPDGKRVVFFNGQGTEDIWVHDLVRDTRTRITITGFNSDPIWSPDGKHIAYASRRKDRYVVMWARADGAGEPQALSESPNSQLPSSFSPDGRELVISEVAKLGTTESRLWLVRLTMKDPDRPKPGRPELLLHTPVLATQPTFSPDGRWLAYVSNEAGVPQVYVQRFKNDALSGTRLQISSTSGIDPMWSRASRELLFLDPSSCPPGGCSGVAGTPDLQIVAVNYTQDGDSFRASRPRFWWNKPLHNAGGLVAFDLSPEGKRLAVLTPVEEESRSRDNLHLMFLLNFFDNLKSQAPLDR